MTRRSSVRAYAREIYRDLAAAQAATPTPDPSPQGGGEKHAANVGGETSLTAQVRALYKDSAVPVREIANVTGVSERTIYKYAAKLRWKRRYASAPDLSSEDLAPARGAGARFIRREDKGQPLQGLKATDPAGARRAQAACREAERLSGEAQAAAQQHQRIEAQIQAMEATVRASCALREYVDARDNERRKKHPSKPLPEDDRVERMYRTILSTALLYWEALLREEKAASAVVPAQAGTQ